MQSDGSNRRGFQKVGKSNPAADPKTHHRMDFKLRSSNIDKFLMPKKTPGSQNPGVIETFEMGFRRNSIAEMNVKKRVALWAENNVPNVLYNSCPLS